MENRLKLRKRQEKSLSLLNQLLDFGIGPIIGVLISMVTVPISTRLVAPEEFGKASLFTLFESLFLIIGVLGLDQGYVRFYNQKNIDKNLLFQNALFFPLLLSFVLIVICIAFLNKISIFLFGSVEIGLMIAFCFFIPVLLLNRFLLLQIRMDLRGKLYSALNISSQVLNFIILFSFLLFYQKTFRSIVYATILGMCLNTFLVFLFCDKSFIKTQFTYSKSLQIDLFRFSLPIMPATLLSWLLNSFDKVGLRTWSNFNELGLYAAAFKIVAILNVIQRIFSTTWIPIAYKWYEDDVPSKKFEDVSTLSLVFMTVFFSFLVVFRNIIMFFLGSEYRNTEEIFVFLLFIPVLSTVSETACLGINFSKKTIFNLYIAISCTVLNILGNYFLIPKYGAIGAAVSTCLSYILFFWLRMIFSNILCFKFQLGKYGIDIAFLIFFSINMILWKNRILEFALFFGVLGFNSLLAYDVYHRNKQYAVNEFGDRK